MPLDDLSLGLSLPTLGARVSRKKKQPESDPENRRGLLGRLGDSALSGLSMVGNVLDLPGSMVRDTLGGQNPFDQLLSPHSDRNRLTGRDLNRKYGLAGQQDTWGNWGGGLATEVLTDPLTYLTFGAGALSKGGQVAKSAGLLDDVGRVAAKKANVEASTMGARTARTTSTLRDVIKDGGMDAARKARTAAKGMGHKLRDIADEPLGGLASVGLPFGQQMVLGTGARGQAIAKGLDTAGRAVRYAKIPGTEFQPLNTVARMFDARLKDTATPEGQAAAKTLFGRQEQNVASTSLDQARNLRELDDLGMGKQADAPALRSKLEDPLNTDKFVTDRRKGLADKLQRNREWGVSTQEYIDPKNAYFPAHMTEGLAMSGKAPKEPFSTMTPNKIGRREFLFGIENRTNTLHDLSKDVEINKLIDGGADRKRIAEEIKNRFGTQIPATYMPKDAKARMLKTGQPVKPKDRYKRLAGWLSNMPKELREAGVFGNHPIHDLAKAERASDDAFSAAQTVLETLAQPGFLKGGSTAARVEGTETVGNVLRKLKMFQGDEAQGALTKLAELKHGPTWKNIVAADPKNAAIMAKDIANHRIPKDIADDLTRMVTGYTSPEPTSEFLKVFDSTTNLTKGFLTGPWPAFHTRNLFSGQWQNFIAGMFSPESVKDAHGIIRGGELKGAAKIPALRAIARERLKGAIGSTDNAAAQATGTVPTNTSGKRPWGWTDSMSDQFDELESKVDNGETLHDWEKEKLDHLSKVWNGEKRWNDFEWKQNPDGSVHYEDYSISPGRDGRVHAHYPTGSGHMTSRDFSNAEEAKNFLRAHASGIEYQQINSADHVLRNNIDSLTVPTKEEGNKLLDQMIQRELPADHPIAKDMVAAQTILDDVGRGNLSVEEGMRALRRRGIKANPKALESYQAGEVSADEATRILNPVSEKNLPDYIRSSVKPGDKMASALAGEFQAPVHFEHFSPDVLSKAMVDHPEIADDVIDAFMGIKKEATGFGPAATDTYMHELQQKVMDAVDGLDVNDAFTESLQAKIKAAKAPLAAMKSRTLPPRLKLTDADATKLLRDLAYAYRITGKGELDNAIGKLPGEPGTIDSIRAGLPGEVPQNFRNVFKGATGNPLDIRGVGGRTESKFAPAKAGDAIGAYVEGLARLSPFIQQLRKGVDPAEAAKKIGAAQVLYQNKYYSKTEQEVLKRLFPFYSFSSRQIPFTLKQLSERPGGRLAQTIRASNRARNPDEFTPDYVSETASIPLGKAADGTARYLTGLGLSMEDPLSLVGGPRSAGLELLSRMNPIIKGPLEYATGESFFQKGPEGGRNLSDMDPTIGRLLANVTGSKQPVKVPFGQEIDTLVNNSPLSRVASTARVLTDTRKGTAGKLANLGTGFKVSDISPGAQDAVLRERAQALEKKLGFNEFTRLHLPVEERASMSPLEQQMSDELLRLDRELALRAKKRKADRQKSNNR